MRYVLNLRVAVVSIVSLLLFAAFAFGQTPGGGDFGSAAGIVVMVTMVLQWIGSFGASKAWGEKARKFIPLANFIVSALGQGIAAFASGLGPSPAPVVAPAVMAAGFFATFGHGALDFLVNSLIQA